MQTYYGYELFLDALSMNPREVFTLWPRRCVLTGRLLWLRRAIRVERDLGTDVGFREIYFFDRHAFITLMISKLT